jgi:hypothetical protein
MILLSFLNAFVPKEIAFAVRVVARHGEKMSKPARDNDPSEWRLRDAGDALIDDRSSSDRADGDRRRPEFPTS